MNFFGKNLQVIVFITLAQHRCSVWVDENSQFALIRCSQRYLSSTFWHICWSKGRDGRIRAGGLSGGPDLSDPQKIKPKPQKPFTPQNPWQGKKSPPPSDPGTDDEDTPKDGDKKKDGEKKKEPSFFDRLFHW